MNVNIIDRSGKVVESIVEDNDDYNLVVSILYTCLKNEMFVLLCYIADYDKTIFNRVQRERFLLEWELLKALLNLLGFIPRSLLRLFAALRPRSEIGLRLSGRKFDLIYRCLHRRERHCFLGDLCI